ncbi:MAG TPA: aminotransferase class V-fold PLP-dependent enzyme [Solirubrobacteraceae bacterium]|nr:aminotransferase class V-fold PLP-dependent enzyme [Solirubrobacteraceae bacterium]
MSALSSEFGPFDGRVWMNCAHQGPLPVGARRAALEAIELKRTPARLKDALFAEVPARLRAALGRLTSAPPEQIALTNSTSYGFNLLAQGLPWQAGDEIVCVEGDFPATVVPWKPLERRGVEVRLIAVPDARLTAEILAAEISPRTRAVCASWVYSFFGNAIDLEACGRACHERDALFFLNGSQALGARAIDVTKLPIDALSCCGFKWLCGPYATGFAWLSPRILERLDFPNPHWLRLQLKAAADEAVELDRALAYDLPTETAADAYDVFCAANFLNFMTWTESVEHLLELGLPRIEEHDQRLVERLVAGLPETIAVQSPREPPARSTLVLASHADRERNPALARELQARGVDIALRDGKLRFSPHLYNSPADVDRVLEALHELV